MLVKLADRASVLGQVMSGMQQAAQDEWLQGLQTALTSRTSAEPEQDLVVLDLNDVAESQLPRTRIEFCAFALLFCVGHTHHIYGSAADSRPMRHGLSSHP